MQIKSPFGVLLLLQKLSSNKEHVNCITFRSESSLKFQENSVSDMKEQAVEHDVSKDFTSDIDK